MRSRGLYAAALAAVMSAVSCNGPAAIKLSKAPQQEVKHYKGFDELKKGASIIGESFTFELMDAEGNVIIARMSIHRPTPERVEITVDDVSYAVDNGNMSDLIDIRRHERGIVFVGRGEIIPHVKMRGKAIVDTANLRKAILQLKTAKGASPILEVEADVLGSRKSLQFSVEQVNK